MAQRKKANKGILDQFAEEAKIAIDDHLAEADAALFAEDKIGDSIHVQEIIRRLKPHLRSIAGPFPRLVGEGETFDQAALDANGLEVIYNHGRAVLQCRK